MYTIRRENQITRMNWNELKTEIRDAITATLRMQNNIAEVKKSKEKHRRNMEWQT